MVLPVKQMSLAKQRLATVLGAGARADLARWLAERTFDVVHRSGARRIAVVTSDPMARALAETRRWPIVPDPGIDHSAAMVAAASWVGLRGGATIATVATDLPLLEPDDVNALLSEAGRETLVIAPNASGRGTNAVVVSPPTFPFAFGPNSFDRHTRSARELGLQVKVLHRRGLAWDLDRPEELALLDA